MATADRTARMNALDTVRMRALRLSDLISDYDASRAAEALAVAVAVSLPWSTSATGILVVLWLIALVPTLNPSDLRRAVLSFAGGLPLLLWAAAVIGMLWADSPWMQRFDELRGYHKLLVIPLLLAQFYRNGRALNVVLGFFWSTFALLVYSWLMKAWSPMWGAALAPGLPWHGQMIGVPFKDYILQSGIFVMCAFGLLSVAAANWKSHRLAAALLYFAAGAFIANVLVVSTSRTALVVLVVFVVLFGLRHFGVRGLVASGLAAVVLMATLWLVGPYLAGRVGLLFNHEGIGAASQSADMRLNFWRSSLQLVARAPLFGHGTGTLKSSFQKLSEENSRGAEAAGTGEPKPPGQRNPADGVVTTNPHSQIFAVAIPLGLLGYLLLLSMWVAHVALFTGSGAQAWFGLLVVVQNIVSCVFNSHLFDFTQGWIYVFGVGVLGGEMLRRRRDKPFAAEK